MLNRLQRIKRILVTSGILIITSVSTAWYIEKELHRMIVASTTKALRHPTIQKKVEELSEKLFLEMFEDEKNEHEFAMLVSDILSREIFNKYTLDLSSKVLQDRLVLDSTSNLMQETMQYLIT